MCCLAQLFIQLCFGRWKNKFETPCTLLLVDKQYNSKSFIICEVGKCYAATSGYLFPPPQLVREQLFDTKKWLKQIVRIIFSGWGRAPFILNESAHLVQL